MEPEITYSLDVTMTNPHDEPADVLALGESDMRYVIEVEPGKVLRVD